MAWAKRCSRGDEGFQRAELQLAQIMKSAALLEGMQFFMTPPAKMHWSLF